MKHKHLNQGQITELLQNSCIVKCSPKSISYSNDFKLLAVQQYAEGMTSSQIFNQAGLNQELVGEDRAKECLRNWRRIVKLRGLDALRTENRGLTKGNKGRPKTKGLTDAELIKRLKIEVAYLKAKNDFLVKLRAKKKS
jgi:transposase-like protein